LYALRDLGLISFNKLPREDGTLGEES